MVRRVLPRLRRWDLATLDRVDEFVAISQTVRERIRRYYERGATVIYPPVDTRTFVPADRDEDYYLVVSALNPSKRVELAVEAFNRLRLPLVVIGDGPERSALERQAGPTVRLLGRLPDDEVLAYYQRCRGFVMPQEEDFGLTALEAQACGRPVIALARGGATETVKDGETGVLFPDPTPESLAEAVRRAERMTFNRQRLRAQAERFDTAVFMGQLGDFVAERWRSHQSRAASCPGQRKGRPQPTPDQQESVV